MCGFAADGKINLIFSTLIFNEKYFFLKKFNFDFAIFPNNFLLRYLYILVTYIFAILLNYQFTQLISMGSPENKQNEYVCT